MSAAPPSTMNQRMATVFGGLALGFGGILIMLTWWQLIAAGELRQRDSNAQTAYYEQRVKRGFIRSADGRILAGRSAQKTDSGDTIYERTYPAGSLAAHVIGYDTRGENRTGVERSMNDVLTGSTRDLGAVFGLLDGNEAATGDNIELTINARAQAVAQEALGDREGSVVALDPQTGKILVMASSPTFSLRDVQNNFDAVSSRQNAPLLNRATQGRYAPGSTFKLITAAAALEDGVTPTTSFAGGCSVDVATGGPPISNFGGSCVGTHDLTYALTNSVNTTFATLGDELGKTKLRNQMQKFGFDSTPEIEGLPSNERRASGLYDGSKILSQDAAIDTARVAIGQERLEVTPLQMAMVVAAIANDGKLMQPQIISRIFEENSQKVREKFTAREQGQAISVTTAKQLQEMMANVVREGTGTAAALQGIEVGGKSGTADANSANQVWFVAFAPVDNPQVAVAVTLENQPSGATGGVLAAPIARDVISSLLQTEEK